MLFTIEKFTDLFFLNLDPAKETIVDRKSNLTNVITRRQHLSKIEYLQLFSIFLGLHKLVMRVNFIVDISDMENSKQIKVSRS